MKFSFTLFIMFFVLVDIYAQVDFRPGYVITHEGDTLEGDIDSRRDLSMCSVCKYKNGNDTIVEFYPQDIKAYRVNDGKYYTSKKIDASTFFLECLITGEVNIYFLLSEGGEHYYIEKEGLPFSEISYEIETKLIDGSTVHVESVKHIGLLAYYMSDAPEIRAQIESISRPTHANLIKLAERYHDIVSEGETYTVYEKKDNVIAVNIEIVSGVISFKNSPGYNGTYFQNGALLNFFLPRTNERLYLKTGMLYSQVENSTTKDNYFKIPVHIGYLAPESFKIRPSFSISLISSSYSAGFIMQATEKINFGVQSWFNCYQGEKMFFIPEKLYNYSVMANVCFEL